MSTFAIRRYETTAISADVRPRRRIANFELWAFRTHSLSPSPHENRDEERTVTFVAVETREEALALAPPAPPGCEWRIVSELRAAAPLVRRHDRG